MNQKYRPLTDFALEINEMGQEFFVGSLELPIAVGSKGGSIEINPAYKTAHQILGNPSASELAMIMTTVGLA